MSGPSNSLAGESGRDAGQVGVGPVTLCGPVAEHAWRSCCPRPVEAVRGATGRAGKGSRAFGRHPLDWRREFGRDSDTEAA